MTIDEALTTIRERHKYLSGRIKAKRDVSWETQWDEREHAALGFVLDALPRLERERASAVERQRVAESNQKLSDSAFTVLSANVATQLDCAMRAAEKQDAEILNLRRQEVMLRHELGKQRPPRDDRSASSTGSGGARTSGVVGLVQRIATALRRSGVEH